jgi:hypothetical protein
MQQRRIEAAKADKTPRRKRLTDRLCNMGWYAVRTVYHFARKADGTNLFEERIVSFNAASFDQALDKAAEESQRYLAAGSLAAHPDREAYQQDGQTLIDGYELWSVLFQSSDSLEEVRALRVRPGVMRGNWNSTGKPESLPVPTRERVTAASCFRLRRCRSCGRWFGPRRRRFAR